MSARPSPAGSPAPRPPPINLEGIYANIPILINRVRNGQLNANQIPPVCTLQAAIAQPASPVSPPGSSAEDEIRAGQ